MSINASGTISLILNFWGKVYDDGKIEFSRDGFNDVLYR